MLRQNIRIISLVLLAGLTSLALPAPGQQRFVENPFANLGVQGAMFKWDPVYQALIFYGDVDSADAFALRAYGAALEPGVRIAPLLDFPGAASCDIWDVTAARGGGSVVSVIVREANLQVRYLLLTYDRGGILRELWDMFPYHLRRIAADSAGNIYGFGVRVDRADRPRDSDYAVLMKYSPDGKLVKEFLFRSAFPLSVDVAGTDPTTGEHELFFANGLLNLYLASTKELLVFSESGILLQRQSWASLLRDVQAALGASRITVHSLAALSGGGFAVQLSAFWDGTQTGRRPETMLIAVQDDLSRWQKLTTVLATPPSGRLIGATPNREILILSRDPNGDYILARSEVSR